VRKSVVNWSAALLLAAPLLALPAVAQVLSAPSASAAVSSVRLRPPLPADPAVGTSQHWRQISDAPYPATLLPRESYRCPAWRRRWLRPDGASVAIVVWTCQRANDAAVGLWLALFFNNEQGLEYAYHPLAQVPNAWAASERAGAEDGGQRAATVFVARGPYVVAASARLPNSVSGTPIAVAAEAIRAELGLIPGRNYKVTPPPLLSKAYSSLVSAFLLVYLIAIGIRYGRNPLRRQRYEVRAGDGRWVDMTARATRLKWSVRGRAVARVFFLFFLIPAVGTLSFTIGTGIWLAIALVLGWIRPVGKSLRYWKPRRVRGTWLRGNRRSWVEPALAIASLGCIVLGGVLCLMDIAVYSLGLGQSPLVVNGLIDPRYLNTLPSWQLVLVKILVAIPVSLLLQATSIAVILLVAAAATMRRYGRRFAVPDADQVRQKTGGGYIVYLRHFGDDGLKMPSSSLGRTSLIERFSIVRLQPFEEILTRHLRNLAPVIGLVKPGAGLPELGAAKVARSSDTWRQQIREWVSDASLVVVAATPAAVGSDFLSEISYLAGEAAHVPVLLVLAPYQRVDIELRWSTFFRAAAGTGPRFRALWPFAEHNSGAHFMTEVPGVGWVAWGAAKRSEYSYATCLAAAFETVKARLASPPPITMAAAPPVVPNPRMTAAAEEES
jgi:hypothetical protein